MVSIGLKMANGMATEQRQDPFFNGKVVEIAAAVTLAYKSNQAHGTALNWVEPFKFIYIAIFAYVDESEMSQLNRCRLYSQMRRINQKFIH